MYYGKIIDNKVTIIGNDNLGKWQGCIYYNENGTRKTAQDIIAEHSLVQVVTPPNFSGNAADYNFAEQDGKIVLTVIRPDIAVKNEEKADKARIAALKKQLTDSDYKVIKCAEYQLRGLNAPYNISDLQAQRQAWRSEINALEAKY